MDLDKVSFHSPTGKQAPAIDQLAIADFFDVSTDYLLGLTDKPEVNR